jgi:hypothetical protein
MVRPDHRRPEPNRPARPACPTVTDRGHRRARSRPPAGSPARSGWPLQVAERSFELLAAGPSPLSVDGRLLGKGLPARDIGVGELRVILMHPATRAAAREAVWRLLVHQTRTGDPAWTLAAVGLAMPGLKRLACRLGRGSDPGLIEDVSAVLLAAFVEALRALDLEGPTRAAPTSIAGWLCWRAFSAAKSYRDREQRILHRQDSLMPESLAGRSRHAASPHAPGSRPGRRRSPAAHTRPGDPADRHAANSEGDEPAPADEPVERVVPRLAGRALPAAGSVPPPRVAGHPDFVLARAVRAGVITVEEADLIGRSRLEGTPMRRIAAARGISPSWACRLRKDAETRLVAAIHSGL